MGAFRKLLNDDHLGITLPAEFFFEDKANTLALPRACSAHGAVALLRDGQGSVLRYSAQMAGPIAL
jgi:hypothetical protein